MSFKQAIGQGAYEELTRIAYQEFRTVQQQIDFMLHRLYGKEPSAGTKLESYATGNNPKIISGNVNSLKLGNRTTMIYRRMSAACELAIKGQAITATSISNVIYGNNPSTNAVLSSSTTLSNLMRNGYLGAIKDSSPRVYVITTKGARAMKTNPDFKALVFSPNLHVAAQSTENA